MTAFAIPVVDFSGDLTPALLETGSKGADNYSDLTANQPQEIQGGHQSLNDFKFVDRYIKGEAHILIHFRDRKRTEFVACLQRDNSGVVGSEDILMRCESGGAYNRFLGFICGVLAWSHAATNWYGRNCNQHAVLVNDIQFVELPELVTGPILVWLDTVENFKARTPKSFYASSRSGLIVFGEIANWERRVSFVNSTSGSFDQGAGEMIERASQVMNSIAEPHCEFGVNGREALDVIGHASRFEVVFLPDGVGICAPEVNDSGIEIIDVLIGPIVFC
jgi:hypothetical protein